MEYLQNHKFVSQSSVVALKMDVSVSQTTIWVQTEISNLLLDVWRSKRSQCIWMQSIEYSSIFIKYLTEIHASQRMTPRNDEITSSMLNYIKLHYITLYYI